MFESKLQQQNYNVESTIWETLEGRSGKTEKFLFKTWRELVGNHGLCIIEKSHSRSNCKWVLYKKCPIIPEIGQFAGIYMDHHKHAKLGNANTHSKPQKV